MSTSLFIEGCVIGLFVIADGVWVVLTPPYGDEPQGYALIAIGIFILLFILHHEQGGGQPEDTRII